MRSWLYQQQQRPDATTPLVPPVSDVRQGSIILSGRHVHRGASLLLTTTTDVLYDMYVWHVRGPSITFQSGECMMMMSTIGSERTYVRTVNHEK